MEIPERFKDFQKHAIIAPQPFSNRSVPSPCCHLLPSPGHWLSYSGRIFLAPVAIYLPPSGIFNQPFPDESCRHEDKWMVAVERATNSLRALPRSSLIIFPFGSAYLLSSLPRRSASWLASLPTSIREILEFIDDHFRLSASISPTSPRDPWSNMSTAVASHQTC